MPEHEHRQHPARIYQAENVGLMFFSLEPDHFFPYAQIDVVQFPEDLGGDQIIEKTFKGSLHQQLREALQYIRNSVIQEQVIKFPDRAEAEYGLPEDSQCAGAQWLSCPDL